MTARPGFTLVELMIVVAILGVLASIGIRGWTEVVERAKVARATQEIRGLEVQVQTYVIDHDRLPATLAEAGAGAPMDPWHHPYVYQPIGGRGVGGARKDRFLVPINSDFDLYSVGKDGRSAPALTAATSRDDVVRANDGGFVGLAEDY